MAREPIRPFEFDMLRSLDGVYLEVAAATVEAGRAGTSVV
jgi:hypothetical protein